MTRGNGLHFFQPQFFQPEFTAAVPIALTQFVQMPLQSLSSADTASQLCVTYICTFCLYTLGLFAVYIFPLLLQASSHRLFTQRVEPHLKLGKNSLPNPFDFPFWSLTLYTPLILVLILGPGL